MTPTPRFTDEYLPALLAQASHVISGEFHRVVAAQGFTVSEWRVLATLSDCVEPMSIGRLAVVTTFKQPSVTRMLDRMELKGHVARVRNGDDDRRVTLVRITPAGKKMVARLIPLALEHEQRVLEPFGLKRAEELKSALRRLVELHSAASEDGAGES